MPGGEKKKQSLPTFHASGKKGGKKRGVACPPVFSEKELARPDRKERDCRLPPLPRRIQEKRAAALRSRREKKEKLAGEDLDAGGRWYLSRGRQGKRRGRCSRKKQTETEPAPGRSGGSSSTNHVENSQRRKKKNRGDEVLPRLESKSTDRLDVKGHVR